MGKLDFFKKLGSGLGGIAPTLAGVIGMAAGGPVAGALARSAVGSVASVLGVESEDPEVVHNALERATPEKLAAIRQADQEFEARMRELELKEDEIHAQDRESARRRQVESKDRMPGYIATAALIGFFGILALLAFHDSPGHSEPVLNVMLGSLGTLVGQIGSYYFGSSKSSQQKTAAMERLLRK